MMTVTIYFISSSAPIQISGHSTHTHTYSYEKKATAVPVLWIHLIHLIWTLTCQMSIKVRTETWHDECLCVMNNSFGNKQFCGRNSWITGGFDDVKCVSRSFVRSCTLSLNVECELLLCLFCHFIITPHAGIYSSIENSLFETECY